MLSSTAHVARRTFSAGGLLFILALALVGCGDAEPAPKDPPVDPMSLLLPGSPGQLPKLDVEARKAVLAGIDVSGTPGVVIETSAGTIEAELWPAAAPKTVKTFIALAEGKVAWMDIPAREIRETPFFDGLTFHRIIDGFMLQGGCPNGNGSGSPGFMFEDEINADGLGLDKAKLFPNGPEANPHDAILGLLFGKPQMEQQRIFHDMVTRPLLRKLGIPTTEANKRASEWQPKMLDLTLKQVYENQGYVFDDALEAKPMAKYTLAMANSGPNTNGSQFFINLVPNPYLNGKHTVFGKVTKGFEIVDKLGKVQVGPGNQPVVPVKILKIRRR